MFLCIYVLAVVTDTSVNLLCRNHHCMSFPHPPRNPFLYFSLIMIVRSHITTEFARLWLILNLHTHSIMVSVNHYRRNSIAGAHCPNA